MDLETLFTVQALIALITLIGLEIVLGIDNVIFIAILSGKLPEEQRAKARNIGLLLAMVQRIVFLAGIWFILKLDKIVLLTLPYHFGSEHPPEAAEHGQGVADVAAGVTAGDGTDITIKSVIVLLGGLFLLYKAVKEIHEKLEGDPEGHQRAKAGHTFRSVITQILLLDLVFSIDSVLTAVGLTNQVPIMIAAVVISVGVMIAFAGPITNFVYKHPTIKMLALSILLMIGVLLVAEGLGVHFPRGYIYFAMAFALAVELLNIKAGSRRKRRVDLPPAV